MAADIDPEILAARAAQSGAVPPFDVMQLPAQEGRRLADAASLFFNDGLPPVDVVEDVEIGTEHRLRLRLYRPSARRTHGGILYLHGGGWYACNVDTHDRIMRCLARDAGAIVVGVDFRLAPEHPFPAALDDCLAAWDWLSSHGDRLGIDPARIAVAGDSAGGNLALALAMALRDRGRCGPAGLALFYPCLAPGVESPSSRLYGQGGYGLTAERMEWYWAAYLGPHRSAPPPLATPLHGDMRDLPPVFIGIAEADTIADESRMLHERLVEAGVPAELKLWEGAVHGFLQMTRDAAIARDAVGDIVQALEPWIA